MSFPAERAQMHTFTPSVVHEQLHPVPVTLTSAEISSLVSTLVKDRLLPPI